MQSAPGTEPRRRRLPWPSASATWRRKERVRLLLEDEWMRWNQQEQLAPEANWTKRLVPCFLVYTVQKITHGYWHFFVHMFA